MAMRRVEVYRTVSNYMAGDTRKLDYVGTFHAWGVASPDGRTYTVAIVETPGGEIELVNTQHVRFVGMWEKEETKWN